MDRKKIIEGIIIGVGTTVISGVFLALVIPVIPDNGIIGVSTGVIAMVASFLRE